jgi:hypothetical protein
MRSDQVAICEIFGVDREGDAIRRAPSVVNATRRNAVDLLQIAAVPRQSTADSTSEAFARTLR